jgi:hypothetical protein
LVTGQGFPEETSNELSNYCVVVVVATGVVVLLSLELPTATATATTATAAATVPAVTPPAAAPVAPAAPPAPPAPPAPAAGTCAKALPATNMDAIKTASAFFIVVSSTNLSKN